MLPPRRTASPVRASVLSRRTKSCIEQPDRGRQEEGGADHAGDTTPQTYRSHDVQQPIADVDQRKRDGDRDQWEPNATPIIAQAAPKVCISAPVLI